MKEFQDITRYDHPSVTYYAPSVCKQRTKSLIYFYQYHQSYVFWIRNLQEMIKNKEESHFYALSLCITKRVPVIVSSTLKELKGIGKMFIFSGLDDLSHNKTRVEVQACIDASVSYTLPVEFLKLDLSFDYRNFLVSGLTDCLRQ